MWEGRNYEPKFSRFHTAYTHVPMLCSKKNFNSFYSRFSALHMLLATQCGEIFVVYGMQIRPKYRCIMCAYVYSNKWLKLYLFMQINKGAVIKDRPRFFDHFGHQTTNASIGNK